MALSKTRKAQLANISGGRSDFYTFSKLSSGRIRIVPPIDEKKPIFVQRGVHFIGGEPYNCPRICQGKSCPICKVLDQLANSGNERDEKIANDAKASTKYLCRIIDRTKRKKAKVIVAELPFAVFDVARTALEGVGDEGDDEGEDIVDPVEGKDILWTKRGQARRTKYSAKVSVKSSPIAESPKKIKKLLKEAEEIDLERFTATPNKKKLEKLARKLMKGVVVDDEEEDVYTDDDDDDEEGTDLTKRLEKRLKKSKKKKKKDADVSRPKKKKKSKKRKK